MAFVRRKYETITSDTYMLSGLSLGYFSRTSILDYGEGRGGVDVQDVDNVKLGGESGGLSI